MATANLAQLYKTIASAKTNTGGTPLQHGRYLLEVGKAIFKQGHKGTCFIVEFKVIESAPLADNIKPNPVGSEASYVTNLDTNKDMAPGNVKAFILGLYGFDEANMTEEEKNEIGELVERTTNEDPKSVHPVQPARGMLIRVETYLKTSGKGKELTLPKWSEVPNQSAEDIAKRRAALDGARKAA